MGVFFFIDDESVNLDDPASLVKDEYHERFAGREFAPFIRSELCALDMLYAVTNARDGYYKERLSLKGGLSVRSIVPLANHRFSFDADFDPNTQGGFTYRDLYGLKDDIVGYGAARRCKTPARVTRDDPRLHFIEMGYRDSLGRRHRIIERPKIEVCKTCRVLEEPVLGRINTIIDLEVLGLKPPEVFHLSLEEQFAMKLFVIGSSGRQRNHFDAYDSFMIFKYGRPDMKKARGIFKELCARHSSGPSTYAAECRRHLDVMLGNNKKRESLAETAFTEDTISFDAMIEEVKSLYNFGALPAPD